MGSGGGGGRMEGDGKTKASSCLAKKSLQKDSLVYSWASAGCMFLERATEGFLTPNDYGCSHRDFSGVEFFFKVLLCSKFSKKKFCIIFAIPQRNVV